ncbi:MAG TPA: aldo/keto reductase [Chthonomonadales bacterium]|nr:aldo/keto reductase [Chthonomonadales bacterium]
MTTTVMAQDPRDSSHYPGDAGAMDATLPYTRSGEMLYRPLGRTGERVSIIGIGGAHMGKQKDPQESIRIVRTAIDRGITFLDNSWDYNHGQSEIRMGEALQNDYRNKVFLMTKFDGRKKEAALQQLDESLARLKTDHIDLWQFHENIRLEDPDQFFASGGAHEAMLEARKSGKVRYLGFTGHKDPVVHLRMLYMAQNHGFQFDTAQMPVNVMDAHFRSFLHNVYPVLKHQGIALLGMKPMGSGIILKSNAVNPVECLHFALTAPTSVVITGVDSLPILDQALEAVRTFKPLSHQQVEVLLDRTGKAAANGAYELFKTSQEFDSTAQHPEWLGYPAQSG